jgi:hypothetical protein
MALRLAFVRVLRGRTLAGGAVYDSAIDPIDHMVGEGKSEPFIVVSSEDESTETTGRDVTSGSRKIDIVVEIAMAVAVKGEGPRDSEHSVPSAISIPSTDAGLEISIGLISREVHRMVFETRSGWGKLIQTIVVNTPIIKSRRGVGNKEGARFAARMIVFTLEVLDDPCFGDDPKGKDTVWGDYIALLEADDELSAMAPLIRSTIIGASIPSHDLERSAIGLSDAAANNLGFASISGSPDEPPTVATEAIPVMIEVVDYDLDEGINLIETGDPDVTITYSSVNW